VGLGSGRVVAWRLGVSHTYIQKLVREFALDPSKMERLQRTYGEATFEQLSRAQELTQQEKARGYLRSPHLWRIAEFKIGGNMVRAVVPTKSSIAARATQDAISQDAPAWTRERVSPYNSPIRLRRQRRRWRPGMSFW
jgi:hypothetical protein